MRLSIFADSKFITDGKGNYYSSSNMRKGMLYPIADKFEKVSIVCRLRHSSLESFPQNDLIKNDKIIFYGVPYFKGVLGQYLNRHQIRPQIKKALADSDLALLRFGSVISMLAYPVVRKMTLPCISQIVGELGMEVRKNHKRIPIKFFRNIVADHLDRVGGRIFRSCDIVTSVNPEMAKKYVFNGSDIEQIVDTCLTRDLYYEPIHVEKQVITAIYAGRLNEFKNIHSFLRAVEICKRKGVTVLTKIVGDGEYRTALEQLANELHLNDQVIFTGRIESREELWELYRSSDIGFMLSRSEGLPLGAIEPMSVGLPILGANLPYLEGVVDNGVEGLLVGPNDIDAIALKLQSLATDSQLRYKLGLNAYTKALLFSSESQAQKIHDLAERLISLKAG